MIFDPTQVDWIFVIAFTSVFYFAFWTPLLPKKLGAPIWLARKTSHLVVNSIIALLPYFMTNLFDFIVTFFILLGCVIITSVIPQIRMIKRVYANNLREEEQSKFFTISLILSILTLWLLIFVLHEHPHIFTAAYFSLAIGDGLGEVIGKPFGKIHYKIFTEKTIEGSIAVFAGIGFSIALSFAIYNTISITYVWIIFVAAVLGTLVEALNYIGIDNSAIPIMISASLYLLMLI